MKSVRNVGGVPKIVDIAEADEEWVSNSRRLHPLTPVVEVGIPVQPAHRLSVLSVAGFVVMGWQTSDTLDLDRDKVFPMTRETALALADKLQEKAHQVTEDIATAPGAGRTVVPMELKKR